MRDFAIKKDTTLDLLKGKIAKVESFTFEIKNFKSERSEHSYREYNDKGSRTLSIHYDNDDKIYLKQVSLYNENEDKIGFINYDENDNQNSSGKYELSNNGNIIAKYFNDECEEEYKYDNFGNIIEVYYPDINSKDLNEYDLNNFLVSQLSIIGGNPLLGGPKNKLTLLKNDKFGNMLEMNVYDKDNNQHLFKQINTYNDKGDIIETINYNADNSIYSHVKYNYQYDSNDNWLLMQTLTKNGEIYREEKRIISYY